MTSDSPCWGPAGSRTGPPPRPASTPRPTPPTRIWPRTTAAGHRSDAARAAALAGVGRGEDSRTLGPEERARWSEQARSWLKHDLAALARRLNGGGASDRFLVRSKLRDWLDDPDLAGVRGPGSPETLPVEEWDAWRAFWKEVHAVLDRPMGG